MRLKLLITKFNDFLMRATGVVVKHAQGRARFKSPCGEGISDSRFRLANDVHKRLKFLLPTYRSPDLNLGSEQSGNEFPANFAHRVLQVKFAH